MNIKRLVVGSAFVIGAISVLTECSFAQTPLDQFKAFLQSPPPIKSLIFKTYDGSNSAPQLRFICWQPDGSFGSFLVRDIAKIEDATNDNTAMGHMNVCGLSNRIWTLEINFLHNSDQLNPSQLLSKLRKSFGSKESLISSPLTNPIVETWFSRSRMVSQTLMLGSQHILLGSLKWTDDLHFQADSFWDESKIMGSITGLKNGLPKGISYHFDDPAKPTYFFTYKFDTNISSFLPAEILETSSEDQNYQKKISLLQVQISQTPLDESVFDSKRYYSTRRVVVAHTDSGNILKLNGRTIGHLEPTTEYSNPHSVKFVRMGVFCVLVMPAFFLLYILVKRWIKKQPERERNNNEDE
jgi:hypothetical protein